MAKFIKNKWILLIILIVFIIFKIPHLSYPFYWDESWSYAPAIKLMYLHGPSLMPNAIDTFYSRGHPLLFYATAAAWMKIFGDSLIAEHSFALFVSALLLISTYEICNRIFNKRVAITATLLLSVQVMFFVQASFMLPEVMVALFVLLTLYFYCREKYLYTFLCCTALVFAKESGMVLGLILGLHAFFNLFNKKQSLSNRIKNFLSILCTGLALGVFFIVQKKVNGWYLFPEHIGLIDWRWDSFWIKFKSSLEILFYRDFRFRLFQLLLLVSIIVTVNSKNLKDAIIFLPALFVYVIVEQKFNWLSHKYLLALFICSLLIFGWHMVKQINSAQSPGKKFIYLGIFFLIGYVYFSSINFFTVRYLMAALVILLIYTAYYLNVLIEQLYNTIYYVALGLILIIGAYGFKYNSGLGDVDLGAFDGMIVQQNIVNYLEQNNFYNKTIACGSFQNNQHLQKPYTGFLHSENKTFSHVGWDITHATDIIIFDNIEWDNRYDSIKNHSQYHLLYRTQKGQAWAEIYGKRNLGLTKISEFFSNKVSRQR